MNVFEFLKEIRIPEGGTTAAGSPLDSLSGERPKLSAYFAWLAGTIDQPIDLFDIASYVLLYSGPPLPECCNVRIGGGGGGAELLFRHNRNRTVLVATDGAARLQLHSPLLDRPGPAAFGGDDVIAAIEALAMPVQTLSLRASHAAEAVAKLTALLPFFFDRTKILVHLDDADVAPLLALDLGPDLRVESIKPGVVTGTRVGTIALLSSATGAYLSHTLDWFHRERTSRVLSAWNKLPLDQRFPPPAGITVADGPELDRVSYASSLAMLDYAGADLGSVGLDDPDESVVFAIERLIAGQVQERRTYSLELRNARIRHAVAYTSGQHFVVHPFSFGTRLDDSTGFSSNTDLMEALLQWVPGIRHRGGWDFDFTWRHPSRVVGRPAFWWLIQPQSYTHFVSESWPVLEHMFRYCERHHLDPRQMAIVVPGNCPAYAFEVLELCGLDRDQVIVNDDDQGTLYATLIVPSLTATNYGARSPLYDAFWQRFDQLKPLPSTNDFDLDALRRFFIRPHHAPGQSSADGRNGTRLFVSRLGDTHYRILLNEAELIEIAESRGYRALTTNGMSMAQKLQAFRNARLVVGPTGPGLFHGIVSGEATLGILHSDTYGHVPSYLHHMAAARDRLAVYCFGTGITSENILGWHGSIHGDFMIDPHDFTTLLDRLDVLEAGR